MKKLHLITVLLVFLAASLQAHPFFYGGSGHVMANQNIASNIFAGWQMTSITSIVSNYYAGNVFSIDLVYKSWVISKGFSTDCNPENEFLTILQTPKIADFGKKWKVFAKVGINMGGQIERIHKSEISTLFGIGIRYN